jgi:predicted P-loop ATPase
MTRTIDVWTPKYVEMPRAKPRSFVVVGTTNEQEHLVDLTGNRRFLPVQVKRIDLDAVVRDRVQLLAEAVTLHRKGHAHWLVRDADEARAPHYSKHAWTPIIETLLESKGLPRLVSGRRFVTLRRALWEVHALATGKESQDTANARTMARVLRSLGWEQDRIRSAQVERVGFAPEELNTYFVSRELENDRIYVFCKAQS